MNIAVLADNCSQTDPVCQVLTAAGHICHPCMNGKAMLDQLHREPVDMLIIDWQVSDQSGAEVLRRAREKLPPALPVLLMVGQAGQDDIIAGLAAGADDYMIKPIRRAELAVRAQVLLRRAYPNRQASETIRFGDILFEPCTGRLSMAGSQIDVTQKEFDLALLFFRNLGRPLSRAYILETVWARNVDIPSRTMDTHVSRVRSKLRLRPENGFRLSPVYSYGYRLEQISAA
jgi:DNA-binding response OmpR family regulator